MSLRHQLPARSPVSLGAVAAGAHAAVFGTATARERLARAIDAEVGARGSLLVDSGTSALALALASTGEGAPVALPAYSCFDVATAADGANVRVLLYDIDPDTLSPDLPSLEAALRAGARAVVVAHLYGVPVDLDPVRELARDAGTMLIEDAAQGGSARYRGRRIGGFGSLSILSFGRGKGWTGGGGGALIAHDAAGLEALAAARARLGPAARGGRALAGVGAQWLLGRPAVYALPAALPFLGLGETVYHAPHPPDHMAHAAVAVALRTRHLAERESIRRRAHAERLRTALRQGRRFRPVRPAGEAEADWLRLPAVQTPRVTDRSARRLGIMPGYPCALTELAGFSDRVLNREHPVPGARALARDLLTFPTHGALREADLRRLEDWIRRAER